VFMLILAQDRQVVRGRRTDLSRATPALMNSLSLGSRPHFLARRLNRNLARSFERAYLPVADQFHGASQVGKEHPHLLPLAFQRYPRVEGPLRSVLRGVGLGHQGWGRGRWRCGGSRRSGQGSALVIAEGRSAWGFDYDTRGTSRPWSARRPHKSGGPHGSHADSAGSAQPQVLQRAVGRAITV
jgi:hypothetical protein